MTDANDSFSKLVPGFEFLQNLVKGAGAAMPHVGQWVAPTLDPAEIEKRIEELRTVQFWLEQNARMLAATIQALEVQRMTLSTLQTMNVSFGDLTDSLKIKLPPQASAAPPAAAPQRQPKPESPAAAPDAPAQAAKSSAVIDPMQWWGALTQQFAELANQAIKDKGAGATVGQDAAGTAPKSKAAKAAVAKPATSAGTRRNSGSARR